MKIKTTFFISLLLVFTLHAICQDYTIEKIDSARKQAYKQVNNDSAFINTCFYIAGNFTYMNMYDSGQVWLNKISARLPLRKPSFFSFYFSVFQSEIYYYNGLLMLDLQESKRIMRIAEELNDSILLATANNFLGLSYMNVDSIASAIPYFTRGIRYARQPPYDPKYWSKSMPHHLYGNLAEAYYKLGKYDSAIINARKSKQLAREVPIFRGVAVAANLEGLICAAQNKTDSAIIYQKEAASIGLSSNQEDVTLVAYGAIARCFDKKLYRDSALAWLEKGFTLLNNKSLINTYFAGQFLDDAMLLYEKYGHDKLLANAINLKLQLSKKQAKNTDAQIGIIVSGSVANETRAAALEVAEAKSKQSLSNTRFLIALLALASMLVLFFVNRHYHKRQLKEIEIRNKISRDLHDDIGATLSSIQIYGELAQQVLGDKPAQSKDMMGKMTAQAKDLMSRMGDVIWSLKTVNADKNSFISRLKNYSTELLAPKEILCTFDINEELGKKITDPVTRKNILLIAKEAMNNIAKYSEASEAVISFKQQNENIVLSITDNGKGYDPATIKNGNGLGNMNQRCEQLSGICKIHTEPGKGVCITCLIPLA